ncbi:hypothetical protein D3C80_1051430 [compost metagenome]
MAAVFDDLEPAVGVAGHLLAHRGEEHVILLPHHIEGRDRQGPLLEVTHQGVHLGGEAEPAFELLLAQLSGLAHEEVAGLLMVLARHDDEGEQAVEPHVGQYVLADPAKLHQHPGADVEAQDGAAEHHALDPLGAELGQVADEDGAKGDADKMRAVDAQVIEQAQDVLGHGTKTVVSLDHLLQLVGLAVATQVEQQHVEVLPVGAQLLEPDGGAAAGAVHEHHPIPIGAQLKGLVVQHLMGSRGVEGYTRRAY